MTDSKNNKIIPLTQGKFASVSNIDYEKLSKHNWFAHTTGNGTWYAIRRNGSSYIKMHRAILSPKINEDVDHIDGDGLNNTRENIRICSRSQNQGRKRKCLGKSSKYKGVSFEKRCGKYKARLMSNRKECFIGYFDNEEEAARAYDKKAKEMFGEFSLLNFSNTSGLAKTIARDIRHLMEKDDDRDEQR